MSRYVTLRPFGQLAEFRNGVNFPASSRGSGELSVIGVGDFLANDRLTDFSSLEKIVRPKGLQDSTLLRDGDLVFVRSNGSRDLIGRCIVLKDVDRPVSHSGFTIRARLTTKDISPEWVGHYFATGLARRAIMRRGGGTNISNLSQQVLQELLVPVPEPRYQAQVLKVANGYSRAIELMSAELQLKTRRRRAICQCLLFGQKRFSEFVSSESRHAGQFGTVPSDWRVVQIGDVATETADRGAICGSIVYSCTKHDGLVPSLEYFGKQVFSRNLAAYKRLQVRDFAYATNHIEEGSIGLLREGQKPGLVSPMYTVFRVGADVDPVFLFALLKTESYRRVFEARMSASVDRRGSLRWNDFARIKIGLPPLQEQLRIVRTLGLLDTEIRQMQRHLDLVRIQRRGILRRLVSGEIEVHP